MLREQEECPTCARLRSSWPLASDYGCDDDIAALSPSSWERLQFFRQRHERAEHLLFFAAGFVFDAFMVTRIDDAKVLIQQGIYLALVGLLLAGLAGWDYRGVEPPRALRGIWSWSVPLLHFMLGTLLNAYALFYVKSASGFAAVIVGIVIASLLTVNELPRMRRFGPVVMYGLYSVCLTSYFAYLFPVLIGRLRPWMFVLAVASSTLPLLLLALLHHLWSTDRRSVLVHVLAPSLGAQAVLLALFAFHLIPPVPLSSRYIGVFHAVERSADTGEFRVSHQSSRWWQFFVNDDGDFRARPGDRIYCFVRVFAPRNFHDQVNVRWAYRDPARGWVSNDAIPIAVVGGREKGFGGYAYKQNWRTGRWRVTVETADGREIGRRTFTVRDDPEPTAPRDLVATVR